MRFISCALLVCAVGCSQLPTQADPITPAQERAIEYCHKYAGIKHVELRAVVFSETTFPVVIDGLAYEAAAWADVGSHSIIFWAPYLERDYVWDKIPALAAHETCHLYYRDSKENQEIEVRAEACARELIGG